MDQQALMDPDRMDDEENQSHRAYRRTQQAAAPRAKAHLRRIRAILEETPEPVRLD